MSEFSRISFIGSGNVAWHLAPALENCGFAVSEVYSRNPKNADQLVKRLYNASRKKDMDLSGSASEFFFVCVSDDAIEEVSKEVVLPENGILIHTSGAVPMDSLSYSAAENLGVFYPLQTFSKDQKVDFKEIPFLIEASDKTTAKKLMNLGKALSRKLIYTSSEDRRLIHVAAVFASNFTNHMLKISESILVEKGYDFEIMKPLIAEMISKSLRMGPTNAQTGPARRNDLNALEEHLQILDDESRQEIYKLISQDIIDQYS